MKIRAINILKIILISMLSFLLASCNTTSSKQLEEKQKKKIKLAEINLHLGLAYLEIGDIQNAKQKIYRVLETTPELPEAWYAMAHFYEVTGNNKKANEHYLKSIQLAPKRGDVLNNYGTFLCATGYYIESIPYFLSATQDPQYLDTAGAYENAGMCALKIPNKQQAMQYFQFALEEDPTRTLAMNELSRLNVLNNAKMPNVV